MNWIIEISAKYIEKLEVDQKIWFTIIVVVELILFFLFIVDELCKEVLGFGLTISSRRIYKQFYKENPTKIKIEEFQP